jgi:hypothetical protein
VGFLRSETFGHSSSAHASDIAVFAVHLQVLFSSTWRPVGWRATPTSCSAQITVLQSSLTNNWRHVGR